jgi:anti-sigma B factor antagonist
MSPSDEPKTISERVLDAHTLGVKLRGELDLGDAPAVAAVLARALEGGRCRLIVDLADVEFLDSAMLHVLLNARRAAVAADGGLVIVAAGDPVRRLLALTGTADVLSPAASLGHAVAALATPPVLAGAVADPAA